MPEPSILLQFAQGVMVQLSMSEGDAEIALVVEATSVVNRTLAGLPEGDRSLIWLRATTLKSVLMFHRAQIPMTADPVAELDQAITILTPAVEFARRNASAFERARPEGHLGWILMYRAFLTPEWTEAAQFIARGEEALRGALTVYGPTSSPLLWGWSLEGMAFASAVCSEVAGCPDPAASRVETRARFVQAAEAYRVAGQEQHAARALALSEKYGPVP